MEASLSFDPRGTRFIPFRASAPRGTMFSPATGPRPISTCCPCTVVNSTMTTASAPSGTGAPVMIAAAWPLADKAGMFSIFSPALISPIKCRFAGRDAKSADRTAYPSRVDRVKGGISRSATMSSARARPEQCNSSIDSVAGGRICLACSSTTRRASSKLRMAGGVTEADMQR